MATESREYRGYRLDVVHRGGWRVFIYAPGSRLSELMIPHTDDPNGLDRTLAEACAEVDRLLGPSP